MQVFFTFLMGIGFAWIYILSGRNLVLVALVHAAHNFLAIAPGAISGSRVPAYDMLDTLLTVGQQPVTGLITAGIPVALGLYGATQYRGKTLAEVMTELGPTDHEENRD